MKNEFFHVYRNGAPLAASANAPSKHLTREAWLVAATELLRNGLFAEHGAVIPTVRVSVGFPGGGSARKRIGEYWHASACEDAVPQIFISPVLEAFPALDTLVHELVHACTPGAGHKKPFKVLALKLGMVGPMRSAGAGPELKQRLNALMEKELGPYPHARVNLSERKKQGTRMLKCECQGCGYTVRTTTKWIETLGAPICPCNLKTMEISQ